MRTVLISILSIIVISQSGNVFAEGILARQNGNEFPYNCLRLMDIQTEITIQNQVVTTTVDQLFENTADQPVSAGYYYPLPENAMVTGFGIWEGDSLVYFSLEPEEQENPQHGEDWGETDLSRYLGRNPFSSVIEDIEPGNIKIRLEYSKLANLDFGEFRFNYPLHIAPFLNQDVDNVSVDLMVTSQRTINSVQIYNYNVETHYETADTVIISLDRANFLPRDNLEIAITLELEETGMWVMTQQDDPDSAAHFLAIIEPGPIDQNEDFDRYFIFVLDASRSMLINSRIREAKLAAQYCISQLESVDHFNVITFNDLIYHWRNTPQFATEQNKNSAIEYINDVVLRNGTDLNNAMLAAVHQPLPQDAANQIMLVSDGRPEAVQITDLPTILENIDNANEQNASIFTVGVGNDFGDVASNLDFMHMIAYQNNGLSLDVPPGEIDVAEAIGRFYDRFSNPAMLDITISFEGINTFENYPPAPYAIFQGMQTIVAGRYDTFGDVEVVLNGRTRDDLITLTYGPFPFEENNQEFSFVAKMWAIQKINYWLAWMSVYGEEEWIVDMIVQLSIQYGILTPFTDYNTDPDDGGGDDGNNPVSEDSDFPLQANLDLQGIRLEWDVNITEKSQISIYRSTSGNDNWEILEADIQNCKSYIDSSIEPGNTYTYRVVVSGINGKTYSATIEIMVPNDYALDMMVYPNPFNNKTTIQFYLASGKHLQLRVFNMLGQEVAVLQNGKVTPGKKLFTLNGRDLSSGTYFLNMRLDFGDSRETLVRTQRVLLLK
ncbi:VWA domain-containing protein [bacterium]|nr:VWA domain-containing protein [bacterium]